KASRAPDEMVQISVGDQGRGVPEDLRERVFDKFFRATGDCVVKSNRPRGVGMGLAIAHGIVEAHGGRIWLESGGDGRGTRVPFTVPVGDEDQDDGEVPLSAATHEESTRLPVLSKRNE